jgi:IclR family acetate operon transcriptional repressor
MPARATSTAANGATTTPAKSGSGTVQSIERAFSLLEIAADHGGMLTLSQLAADSGLPMPTIHRLVRTLVDLGYMRQEPSRQYVLGPRLIRLGESTSRMLGIWARPHLSKLVDVLGESANLAMLDGDQVVYIAQVQSKHSMRMFTEVGRRVNPHCTAVGKAMLARMPRESVHELLKRTGMPRHTDHTITTIPDFDRELEDTAAKNYAVDEGEQEIGVRCVAVVVPNVASKLAISVSGPATRMTDALIERAVPLLGQACASLSKNLQ